MIKLVNYLDNKYKINNLDQIDLNSMHLITSPKHDLMGVVMREDLLILHYKYFYSFRFNIQNIGYCLPFYIGGLENSINKEYLEHYFYVNQDNPYALYNVVNCIINKRPIENLTQFPPLYFKKNSDQQRKKIDELYNIAEVGDSIFTFDRSSGISRLIRKIDRGQWSHVGMVGKDKKIYEMTTSGYRKSDFSCLYKESLDVALYRIKKDLNPNEKEELQRRMEYFFKLEVRFNWVGIVCVFLHKKLGIPIKHGVTPADIIYNNQFKLMAYA